MKRAIHVGVFLLDLCRGQSSQVVWGGGIDVEDLFVFPFLLALFLEVYRVVALAHLGRERLDDRLGEMKMKVRTWADSIV